MNDKNNEQENATMLNLQYLGNGKKILETYSSQATMEKYHDCTEWLKFVCEKYKLQKNIIYKLELILEEVFTNIVNYAYSKVKGEIKITFSRNNDDIILTFIDKGIKYNPLAKEDPDITLCAEDRNIGGLGIFIVKKSAKSLSYEYSKNKENILTVVI